MIISSEGGMVFLRHTNTDGSQHVEEHQTWNRQRFLASNVRYKAEANEKIEAKDGIGLAKVEVITQDEYRAERWRK